MIGEFLEQLNKFPGWNKTRYYCFVSELLDVHTGRGLKEESLKQMSCTAGADKMGADSVKNLKMGEYRLGQYQITVDTDGGVTWQTYGGINKVIHGRCLIESGILFIDPSESKEEAGSKREFLDRLHSMLQWDGTIAWSRNLVLKSCPQQEPTNRPRTFIPRQKKWSPPVFIQTPPGSDPDWQEGRAKQSFPIKAASSKSSSPPFFSVFAGIKWPNLLWFWPLGRKFWLMGLFLLVFTGLIIGLGFVLHSLEEKNHWPHWFKEHHHDREHHFRSSNLNIFYATLFLILIRSLP